MVRRRSDATMTILAMGLGSIALFGAVVVFYSRQTPILRLRPELEQRFGVAGFETRFVAQGAPYIQVSPPAALALPDEYARAEVGAWALDRYREITEQRTVVTECQVLMPDGASTIVDLEMASMLHAARAGREQQLEALRKAGLLEPDVQVRGVVHSGVHLEATGRAPAGRDQEERRKLARKAALALSSFSCVSRARVDVLDAAGNAATELAGRDVPPPPRKPIKPPPPLPPAPPPTTPYGPEGAPGDGGD